MTFTSTGIPPAITKTAYGCEPILHIVAQLLYLNPDLSCLGRSECIQMVGWIQVNDQLSALPVHICSCREQARQKKPRASGVYG